MTRGKRSSRPKASRKPAARRSIPGTRNSSVPPAPSYAMLLAGPEVTLLNISKGGVLLECSWQLSTAAIVCLKLVTMDTVFVLKGRVLRSRAPAAESISDSYESVIAFEEDFVLLDSEEAEGWIPADVGAVPTSAFPCCSPEDRVAAAPILTLTASARCSGPEMRQILGLK